MEITEAGYNEKECEGNCPKCGNEALSYGGVCDLHDSRRYPFTCDNCGCEGSKVYDIVYGGTQWPAGPEAAK